MGKTKSTTFINLYKFIILFLPLLFSPLTNEGYEFPKTHFLYVISGFLLALLLTESIVTGTKLRFGSKWAYLYLGSYIISTLLSSHIYTSVVGYYTRFNGGLLSVLAVFALYFIAINEFTRLDSQKILRFGVFAILPLSIYGLAQYSGNIPFLWASAPLERVSSTIGQPNWLAQYLVVMLPLCLYFALIEESLFLTGIYLVGFFCFWLTFSLSGYLGFVVSFIGVVWVLKRKGYFNKPSLIRLGIVVTAMGFVVLTNLGFVGSRIRDVIYDIRDVISLKLENVVYAQTNEDNTERISDPGKIRFGIWGGVLKMVTSSPKNLLFGTGPETFPYTFQPFRPLALNYSSEWEFVFNKPHNYYLELLAEEGIIGLSLWLVLLALLFKNAPSYVKPSVVGFALTNFFGWPVSTTAFLFWFLLSFAGVKEDE